MVTASIAVEGTIGHIQTVIAAAAIIDRGTDRDAILEMLNDADPGDHRAHIVAIAIFLEAAREHISLTGAETTIDMEATADEYDFVAQVALEVHQRALAVAKRLHRKNGTKSKIFE